MTVDMHSSWSSTNFTAAQSIVWAATRIDRTSPSTIESRRHVAHIDSLPPRSTARTPASGAGYRGSNPWGAAKFLKNSMRSSLTCSRVFAAQYLPAAIRTLRDARA